MSHPIQTISREDPRYPKRLLAYPDMPSVLYLIGSLPEENVPTVGIVGARLCDQYGKKTAEEFSEIFAAAGIQVISGMAIGIDSLAQKGALAGGGKSFAVLGSGVDVCYPPGNQALYDTLCRTGGVLSEQPPGTPPLRRNFPLRNRIISGLSDILLVVEAKSRSGSLITADFALEQGKSVYAVPGRVGDLLSDGCNQLIAQGAGIAWSPEPIIEELSGMHHAYTATDAAKNAFEQRRAQQELLRREQEKRVLQSSTLSDEGRTIYGALLWDEPLSADMIGQKTKLPIAVISATLTQLTLMGFVSSPVFNCYQRALPQR